ncbi:NTP transferase domain-containing protein [Thalassospira australica]|uniref:nucleotidyltransferase family protein n=1 Tax=Thalassospira australica TaxID=1528106 RepID=UPI00384CFEE6
MTRIACLILAAGGARRFGGRKQLAGVHGIPMLRHVIDAVCPLAPDDVYVVIGAFASDIRPILDDTVHVVENPDWHTGIGGSIAVGVSELVAGGNYDGVLIVLGDQVALTTDDYRRIVQSFAPDVVSVADYADTVGAPALFPKQFMTKLTRLKGDQGAKKIVLQGDWQIRRVPMERAVIDIDTSEDLGVIQADLPGS